MIDCDDELLSCHLVRGWLLAQVTSLFSMYYSQLFKTLPHHRITSDYYDCHVRREAFVGPHRYDDEQLRFFRLMSVGAMNLRALRSLGMSWFIRTARFRTVPLPFFLSYLSLMQNSRIELYMKQDLLFFCWVCVFHNYWWFISSILSIKTENMYFFKFNFNKILCNI